MSLLLLVALCQLASAAELITNWLTVADGLPTNWTSAIAEDDDGLIWIGGPGWMVRYDGERMHSWSIPRPMGQKVVEIVPLPDGPVVFRLHDTDVFLIDENGVSELMSPAGELLLSPTIRRDRSGGLLTIFDGVGWRWSPEGGWTRLTASTDGLPLTRIVQGPADSLLYATKSGWYRWEDGEHRLLLETKAAVDAAVEGDRIWLMGNWPLRVWRADGDDEPEQLYESESYNFAWNLSPRDGAVWFNESVTVIRLGPDGTATRYENNGSGNVHGRMAIDSAGSLWASSLDGLLYAPDPGLERWTTHSGFRTNTIHSVVRFNGDIWAGSWNGLHRVLADGSGALGEPRQSKGRPCIDREGNLWMKIYDELGSTWKVLRTDGSSQAWDFGGPLSALSECRQDHTGRLWMVDHGTLYVADDTSGPPRAVGEIPESIPKFYTRLLTTRSGWVWVGAKPEICGISVEALFAGSEAWTCHEITGRLSLTDLHETERGTLWAAKRDLGLLVRTEDGFQAVPGFEDLDVYDLSAIFPSPRGGQWLVGIGAIVRVLDHPDGLVVVEEVPEWVGRTLSALGGGLEEADGTLWLATNTGLVKVPERMRNRKFEAPYPRVVLLNVDGEPRSMPVEMAQESTLTLEVSTISFRAPKLVRYRNRLDGGAWSDISHGATLHFSGLSAGQHTVEVITSLDGQTWSEPLQVPVTVTAPWWRRWELWAGLVFVVMLTGQALLWVRHRVRMRAQNLRTRVAMDLHDELGAGLASMGLLAGMIARGSAGARAGELAGRIAQDAGSLGSGLSGIVWSLRPGHDTVGALLDYIIHRAGALLPELGEENLGVLRSPALDEIRLDLDVLRALQLIALEALNNIAKHARADRVWINIERSGSVLRLSITDDGVGLSGVPTAPDRGLGLQSMAQRIEAVGGRLELTDASSVGTSVVVTFRPQRSWWRRIRR